MFFQTFFPVWQKQLINNGKIKCQRVRLLTVSEIMTILIALHQFHHRNFRAFYYEKTLSQWRSEFPGLVIDARFFEYIPYILVRLMVYLRTCCLGNCTGSSFVDSTSLDVCLNQRIPLHRVSAGLVERRKTSIWFFGFILHLVAYDWGKFLQFCISSGNVDDCKSVPRLAKKVFGKLLKIRGLSHNH